MPCQWITQVSAPARAERRKAASLAPSPRSSFRPFTRASPSSGVERSLRCPTVSSRKAPCCRLAWPKRARAGAPVGRLLFVHSERLVILNRGASFHAESEEWGDALARGPARRPSGPICRRERRASAPAMGRSPTRPRAGAGVQLAPRAPARSTRCAPPARRASPQDAGRRCQPARLLALHAALAVAGRQRQPRPADLLRRRQPVTTRTRPAAGTVSALPPYAASRRPTPSRSPCSGAPDPVRSPSPRATPAEPSRPAAPGAAATG